MSPIEVGNWMRDAGDNDLIDFIEQLQDRLGDRELTIWKQAQRDLEGVRKARAESLERWRAQLAHAQAERERRERPFRIAREYEAACRAVFGEAA